MGNGRAAVSVRAKRREEDLRQAAASGDIAVVKRLLTEGCDPNSFDELGMAALHHAAEHERLEIVELLLQHGADVNGRDERRIGDTPLGEVASTCSLALARLLVQAGANPTIAGWMGQTPLDRSRARKRGDGPRVHELFVAAAQRWSPGTT